MKGNNILKFIDKNIAINKAIGLIGGIDLLALKDELVENINKADAYDKIMELTGTNDARLELTDKGAEELRHYLDKVREAVR